MIPRDADTVLVRHSELGIKSHQVQHRMERLLAGNLERMLADRGIDATVTREHGRLYLRTDPEAIAEATTVATETVGVVSASPAVTMAPTMEAMCDALADLGQQTDEAGSFAVRARRAGHLDDHPFTSQEIEKAGGAAIWEGRSDPVVDLEDPDRTYYVECRQDEAFVFLEKRSAPGGFPYGSQGRVVALVSGGIDSPVAAWEMMRRGCEIVPLYVDFEQYGGPDHVARAFESLRHVARYVPDGSIKLHRVPGGDAAEQLMRHTGPTRMLSLRRFMFAGAEHLADRVDAEAIATGESIGQKSSQTGHNIALTAAHVRRPIHRPLLGFDKQEIIDRAKTLGTFEDATIDAGCNRLAPTHPETAGTLASVRAAEPNRFLREATEAIAHSERVTLNRHEMATDAGVRRANPDI